MQILRSLSKVINETDKGVDSYCITNTARPLLSVGPKGGKGSRRTYLFVEALRKYNEEIKRLDLSEAYKKALPMYAGRLERTFVVLKEGQTGEPLITGGNREPIGKRALDDVSIIEPPKRPALG